MFKFQSIERVYCQILERLLGKYLDGLQQQNFSMGFLTGNVKMTNVAIKRDALKRLNLPLTVRAGFVGSLSIEVSWRSLFKKPLVIKLDQVHLIVSPKTDSEVSFTPLLLSRISLTTVL